MKNIFIVLVVLVLVGAGGATLFFSQREGSSVACTAEAKICPDGSAVGRMGPTCDFAACPTPATTTPVVAATTAKLNQKITTGGVLVAPLQVVEDSRCPVDVQCIQAGTVRLSAVLESGTTKETAILTMGTLVKFMNKQVELISVLPTPSSKQSITQDMYRFTFRVSDNVVVVSRGTLSGTMTIGPICPVERVDNPCLPSPETYAARKVFVYTEDKKTLVTILTPDAKGKFSVTLPVGRYFVDMTHERIGSITGVPKTITIEKGVSTEISISVDTGIR